MRGAELDFRGLLSRTLDYFIEEESDSLQCTRTISSGPHTTHYRDVCSLHIPSHHFPVHWRDHLHYELRKYDFAGPSLRIEDSQDCTPDRRTELATRWSDPLELRAWPESKRFVAISFHLSKDHEVRILLFGDFQLHTSSEHS